MAAAVVADEHGDDYQRLDQVAGQPARSRLDHRGGGHGQAPAACAAVTAVGVAGDLAVEEVDGALGVTGGQLGAVGDQDQGLPVGVEVQQQLADRLAVGGVQRTGWFVGQQQGGGVDQGAGDGHPLAFPA